MQRRPRAAGHPDHSDCPPAEESSVDYLHRHRTEPAVGSVFRAHSPLPTRSPPARPCSHRAARYRRSTRSLASAAPRSRPDTSAQRRAPSLSTLVIAALPCPEGSNAEQEARRSLGCSETERVVEPTYQDRESTRLNS